MKNAILMLRENMDYMSNTEQKTAEYILEHAETVVEMNIQELAQATFSSVSTIYRMCQKIGFEGYKDFKKSLIYDLAMRGQDQKRKEEEILKSDSLETIVEKVTYKNIIAVEDTKNLIDPVILNQCVDLISQAATVLILGVGASFCSAKDAYLKFLRVNKPCAINEDWHSQLLMALNSRPEDVGIVISYSGETEEMVQCMEIMKKNHTPIIAITRFAISKVAKLADYRLYTAANEAIFRSGAMSSRISQLNLIDILYTAYINRQYDTSLKQFIRTQIKKKDI